MDNEIFRDTYYSINERFCPYERSILTNHCACSNARRFCIGEREGINCASDEAQARCLELLKLMRQQARFALKSTREGAALPHAKAMRIQVGGLRGLQATVTPDEPVPTKIANISGVIETAITHFGELANIPFQTIIQQIAAFKGRRPLRGLR